MSSHPEPIVRVPPGFDAEFPGASALATECILNMGLLAGAVMSHMSAMFRDVDLPSAAAFNVLTVVDGAGGTLPPSVIAERMLVSRPTITGVLETLEKRRLIDRVDDPSDGRSRLVAITAKGHAIAQEMVPRMHALERDIMAALTEREKRTLLSILARLQAQLKLLDPDVRFTTPS